MKIDEIQEILETLTGSKISITQICETIGMSRQNFYERKGNKSNLRPDEVEKLEEKFKVKLIKYNAKAMVSKIKEAVTDIMDDFTSNDVEKYNKKFEKWHQKNYGVVPDDENYNLISEDDCINIEYIGINPSCGVGTMIIDEPEIRKIKLSNDLISHVLKCSHPENLKVFKAQGDSMETIIEDGDLLLVDIGRVDVYNGGIYVFSIDENWRVKRFRLKLDKVLEIISDNPKYDIELIMPDSKINLKIRGKVIKNLSRGL